MGMRGLRFRRTRWLRCVAASLVLVALALQAAAGYLPMPALGGITSWQAMVQPCPEHASGSHKAPVKQHQSCSVCLVIHQAGSTMASADIRLAIDDIVVQVQSDGVRDGQTAALPPQAFSSRAPPALS